MKNDYITIKNEERIEVIEKKSKFIATIKKIRNKEEAQIAINQIKKEFSDASHNTYAYSINEKNIYQKYSDDNEPKGTAGLPILDIINHKKIENVLIVVTRYFGGTLLGIGGLVRAYSKAAVKVIDKAKLVINKKCKLVSIKCNYSLSGIIQNYIKENKIEVVEIKFLENVIISILIPLDCIDRIINDIINLTSNNCKIVKLNEKYMEMEI